MTQQLAHSEPKQSEQDMIKMPMLQPGQDASELGFRDQCASGVVGVSGDCRYAAVLVAAPNTTQRPTHAIDAQERSPWLPPYEPRNQTASLKLKELLLCLQECSKLWV